MAKGTFGERLKRERELREVTLTEIASATRIAPRFLEALENEEWDQLPGGVFGRGFVRTIARYLGLSEEDLLSEYDLARGESAEPRPEERIPSPSKWVPVAAVLAALVLLALLLLWGRYAWRRHQSHRAENKSSAAVSLPSARAAGSRSPLAAKQGPPPGILLELNAAAGMAPLPEAPPVQSPCRKLSQGGSTGWSH